MNHEQHVETGTCRLVAAVAIFLVGAFCLQGSTAEGQQSLRWKFQPSSVYHVTFQQKTTSKTQVGDQIIEVRLHMTMEMDWKILQVDAAGLARMEQSFRRIRIKLENPKVESVLYDSSADTKPGEGAAQIAASLSPLIGKPFQVEMTPRGVVQKVTLSPQAQAALNRIPEQSRLKDVFTTAGLTQTLKQSHGILPEKAVQPGDHWESNSKLVTALGDLEMKSKYQYVEDLQESGLAVVRIEVQGQLELVPAKDQGESTSQLKIKSQKMSGYVLFSNEQGRMLRSTMTQTLETESRYRDLLLTSVMTSQLVTTVNVTKQP